MIDYDVLEAFSTTNERLKEIFSAEPIEVGPVKGESKEDKKARIARERQNDRDIKTREQWRAKLISRTEEGISNSLKNWRLYATVDLAWDSTVISKTTIPLQMHAQGKINVQRCAQMLSGIEGGNKFIKKDDAGQVVGVDVPRFIDTECNLIRSVISRRHGAQKNKFNQLWPYYDYEARSTGLAAKCRADVLSQRVDMMVDQFGYRHHDSQVMREGLLYGHVVDFVRSSWEIEKQYQRKSIDGDPKDVNEVIVKEGIGWFNPHPTRVFWDNARPLPSINEDDGTWIGFWDTTRFSDISDDPCYFNKQAIGWSAKHWGPGGMFHTYADYFNQYSHVITPPYAGTDTIAFDNDRKGTVGIYSGSKPDSTVVTTNYFEKVVPKDCGLGDYPHPVWLRLVLALDGTVIFAEWMPSTPAAVLSINECDARQVNVSMAMELFSYQDQMTNLLTHLMLMCQLELLKVISINTDGLEPEQIKALRAKFSGQTWCDGAPVIVEASFSKMDQMGIGVGKDKKIVELTETKVSGTISSIFESMIRLVEMTERLMALSPAEQGQPAPREISATEVNEIATTTSSVYSAISEDIDEFRGAKKRIVYESLVACSKGEIVCPVKDRYTAKTIISAGFKPKENEDEDYKAPGGARRYTVIGSKRFLVHDYIFTSRDGAERPVNTQAANTLVQLIGQVMSVPAVAQACGKQKLFELFNEVFRLSGAGVDLNLTLREGEEDTLGGDEMAMLKQSVDEMAGYLQQMAGQTQKNAEGLATQEQVNKQQEEAIKAMAELGKRVQKTAEDVSDLHGRHDEIQKRLVETLPYDKAPPSIQRQMEEQAGFVPAPDSERIQQKPAAPKK